MTELHISTSYSRYVDDMPLVLGVRLEPHSLLFFGCEETDECRCRRVPHHDHIYDAFHRDLLDILSPASPGDPTRRIDSGRAFCSFLRNRGLSLIERLEAERTASGNPVVRFETTLVCDKINAVDGNGKAKERSPHLPPQDLTYWSMTPEELQYAFGDRSRWKAVLDKDGERRGRRSLTMALARTLVEEHCRAEGTQASGQIQPTTWPAACPSPNGCSTT